MKPGSVPTARVGPIIGELVAERWPHGGGFEVLGEKVGCDSSAIEAIVRQDNLGVKFDLADRVLCALGRPDIWQGQLADLYHSVSLVDREDAPLPTDGGEFRCGHPRTPENIAVDRKGDLWVGFRCRECRNANRRKSRANQRAMVAA